MPYLLANICCNMIYNKYWMVNNKMNVHLVTLLNTSYYLLPVEFSIAKIQTRQFICTAQLVTYRVMR